MAPFRSDAQRKYLFAKHPKVAKEFAEHTPKGAELPEHVDDDDMPKRKKKPRHGEKVRLLTSMTRKRDE